MEDIAEKIKTLTEELLYHERLYYNEDNPLISDREYDIKLRELTELEAAYPQYRRTDSPTTHVGGAASSSFKKVPHAVKMESLSNAFSHEEVCDFMRRVSERVPNAEFTVEPKIDGLSVSLLYENGVFSVGSTRGDGLVGEDISENLRRVRGVPARIQTDKPVFEVRGEVYMPREEFLRIVERQTEDGETPFKNPRNAAAGSLRRKDAASAASFGLSVFVFNLQQPTGLYKTHRESIDALSKLGFATIPSCRVCKNEREVLGELSVIGEKRASLPFDIDGAVIKLNNIAERELLGSTDKFPRWATAYKYPPEIKRSVIRSIEIGVGRTGVLTPTAVFDPVVLSGATVSRAVLHNEDFIKQLDVRIGDTVEVHKAGDVIPEIVSVISHAGGAKPFEPPSLCPSCGERVVRLFGEAALRCVNPECPEQLRRNIINFVSRQAMDVEGLGESTIDQLIDKKLISNAADLYFLTREQLLTLDKVKDKSADNILKALNISKSRGLTRVLTALGIRNVGKKTASLIAERFGSIDAIIGASLNELSVIDGIGPIVANSVVEFFGKDGARDLISRLKSADVDMTEQLRQRGGALENMLFVVTGTLPTLSRDEAHAYIERNGGKTASSVSAKTTYLVAGESAGGKLARARELGVKVITEAELFALAGE